MDQLSWDIPEPYKSLSQLFHFSAALFSSSLDHGDSILLKGFQYADLNLLNLLCYRLIANLFEWLESKPPVWLLRVHWSRSQLHSKQTQIFCSSACTFQPLSVKSEVMPWGNANKPIVPEINVPSRPLQDGLCIFQKGLRIWQVRPELKKGGKYTRTTHISTCKQVPPLMTQWSKFWLWLSITMTLSVCASAHLSPWRTVKLKGERNRAMSVLAGLCNRLIRFKFYKLKAAGKQREVRSYSGVAEWVAEICFRRQTERFGPRHLVTTASRTDRVFLCVRPGINV